jgi:membrane protease subunit (stomatin/prohibitin family)
MGLFNFVKGELIDIIEWLQNENDDVMGYRFERHDNEIKNGAKLVVRESQAAVFINEGQMADVFGPGTYTLSTQNLPLLSTLKGWKYGFDSPFKAEVYFINCKRFTGMGWGTPREVNIRDKDFGMVPIRAFGTYTIKVNGPDKFIKEVVGTDNEFTTDEITDELRSMIVTSFITAIGESGLSLLDFAMNYTKLSKFCEKKLNDEFKEYGLELTKFLISNINIPDAVQAKIEERSGMNIIGNANEYSQFKQADAMMEAAKNPGGGGGMEGMMGMAMMNQMMNQNKQQNQQHNQQNNPPPPPPNVQFHVTINGQQMGPYDLNTIRQMIGQNQITKQTYVWKQGMSGWMMAEQVPEVAGLFAPVPPPPPPPPPM